MVIQEVTKSQNQLFNPLILSDEMCAKQASYQIGRHPGTTAAIIGQILPGIEQANGHPYAADFLNTGFDKKGYAVEPDRRRAIELAILVSRADDAVLIAGKGHETYQIIGDRTIDFDDREEARKALAMLDA